MRLLSLRRFFDLGFCLGREDRKPSNRLVRAFSLPRNVDLSVFTPIFRQHDRNSVLSEGSGNCEALDVSLRLEVSRDCAEIRLVASDELAQRSDVYLLVDLHAPV